MAKQISEEKRNDMLNMPLLKLIPRMALPTVVAQLITTVYNLVDAYFVSTLGTNATAAIGVNSSLERTITLIGSLIGTGAASYIARKLGAKEKDKANMAFATSTYVALAIGAVMLVVGLSIKESLVYWLGATDDCALYSVQYAQYVLLAAPFMIASMILNACLRSEGRSTLAMIGMGFGGILNCILDPIFIFGLNLGVAGASMATAISKFISFLILIYPYAKKRCSVGMSIKYVKFEKAAFFDILAIGSTAFFRSGFAVVANIVTNRIAGEFSTSTLAAMSVSNRVMEFSFAIILGFGLGYQPIFGFNWGAKNYPRVKESLRLGSLISISGGIIMGLLMFVGASPIIRAFNSAADQEVMRIGLFCVRMQCVALPIHAWVSIINMFYAGVGKAKQALAMSTARQGYCLIPMVLILPKLFSEYGLASSQSAADFLSLAVGIPLWFGAIKLINKTIEKENGTPAIL